MTDFDLAIIGGGIAGAGVARDAAGRGIRAVLLEQNDLASGASSASTGLIRSGLRYVEQGRLVAAHGAIHECGALMRIAPHLIRPLRVVLPHHDALGPAWWMRFGLFVHDLLGRRENLPPSRLVDLTYGELGVPLKRRYKLGFEYSECRVDGSRLVVLNALDAAERGATVRTHARVVRVDREQFSWRIALNVRGRREIVTARVLVDASGPWVADTMQRVLRIKPPARFRLVKGSHVVVRRLFDHDRAYILRAGDGRAVHAIPHQGEFTLLGTAEEAYEGDPGAAAAGPHEITALCRAAAAFFRDPVEPGQVVRTFAGIRVLQVQGTTKPAAPASADDCVLVLDAPHREAPLLTIYGGTIGGYRRLAEAVLARTGDWLATRAPAWTHAVPLPGGEFPVDGMEALVVRASRLWPFLTDAHARRLVAAYGTRVDHVLGEARKLDDLGPRFGSDLTAAEVRYLMRHEWALTADDVLWRRSKLGLHVGIEDKAALGRFMAEAKSVAAAR